MKILITGLCTVHWGRMEYGNVGNYYIIESLFKELERVFPNSRISTTFQFTDDFINKFPVTVIPMETYYAWNDNDLNIAMEEFGVASYFAETKIIIKETQYIKEVLSSDLIIDLSGDMWGDYAEHVGENRFLVNLLKMRSAQLLGKKTVLFAGSQGPFREEKTNFFAKTVYENYTAVLAREPQAIKNVEKYNFNISNTKLFACPAFLFEPANDEELFKVITEEIPTSQSVIGVTICGFNMDTQPYDKWPREDSEYDKWVEILEETYLKLGASYFFISHSNGFELPPNFKPIHGRDYPILKQLQTILTERGIIPENKLLFLDGVYTPRIVKAVIGKMTMMITGRVHASVAAISQSVPTVFIPYTESMESTKILGFASLVKMSEYVVYESKDIQNAILKCFSNKDSIRSTLEIEVPITKQIAKNAFDYLKIINSLTFHLNLPKQFPLNEITSYLKEMDNDFVPPLNNLVDNIDDYANKIIENAYVLSAKDINNNLIAIIALYVNENYSFITTSSVKQQWRNNGIFKDMLIKICEFSKSKKVQYIEAEVYNECIFKVYEELGFILNKVVDYKRIFRLYFNKESCNGTY